MLVILCALLKDLSGEEANGLELISPNVSFLNLWHLRHSCFWLRHPAFQSKYKSAGHAEFMTSPGFINTQFYNA